MPPVAESRTRAYQQVIDSLVARIEAGEFRDAGRLPTEAQLISEYRVSNTTIHNALRRMAAMGIVEGRQGSGTYVVERKLLTINATHTEDLGRRKGVTAQDSWSTDALEAGRTPRQDFECLHIVASPELATRLGVEAEAPVVVRRCWRFLDNAPASIETSWFPQWLVDAVPRLGRGQDIAQGTTSYVAEQGYPMLWHQDELTARQPTPRETTFFRVSVGVPVLIRTRTSLDKPGGRVLRLMETVYLADRHRVLYEVAGQGNVQHSGEGESDK